MHHTNVKRTMKHTVVALLAVGTLAPACTSSDDSSSDGLPVQESGDSIAPDSVSSADDRSTTGATDAESSDPEPASEETEDSGRERTVSIDEAQDLATAAPEEAEAPQPDDGGLFDEDPADAEERFDDDRFEDDGFREFVATADDPLSTFALDVDTGSYSIARRFISEGSLPPRESVRPEEYVNAFDYDYDTPRDGLDVSVDGGPSPFDDANVLVRVGVQGEEVADEDRGRAALTFVIDTSGSMDRDDRLGLVKDSLEVLVDELDDDDTVAIVTYSDDSGVVLEPTPVRDRERILDAIDELGPGGSTNLESGLREGYELAREAFDPEGINRVVLASDGVANAGVTDPVELAQMIRDDADEGIDLVTVGFGMGDFNDVTMEQLADNGDGFYAYVDTIDEAERLFEDELTSTLLTVAKDAKIQVEFDERFVSAYRLIGFENRGVRDSDFRDDSVDAGELGAGHQVTAIYELELADDVDLDDRAELGIVVLRWEDPDSGEITEIDEDVDLRDIVARWSDTPDDFQLATVVTTFAEKLRDNPSADDVEMAALAGEVDRLADVFDEEEIDELADLVADATDLAGS